jgi:hypothetical protein
MASLSARKHFACQLGRFFKIVPSVPNRIAFIGNISKPGIVPFEKGGSRADRCDSAGPASGIPLSLTKPAKRLYFL